MSLFLKKKKKKFPKQQEKHTERPARVGAGAGGPEGGGVLVLVVSRRHRDGHAFRSPCFINSAFYRYLYTCVFPFLSASAGVWGLPGGAAKAARCLR